MLFYFISLISIYMALCYVGFVLIIKMAVIVHNKVRNFLVSFVFKYFLVFIVLLHVGISMLAPLWIAKIFPVFTITEESSTFLVLFGCCNAALMLWLAARSEEGKKFRTLQGY